MRVLETGAVCFFFSSRRRHTRFDCDWSSDVCSSDLHGVHAAMASPAELLRKSFGIKLFRIENVQALSGGQEHHCGMAPSRSVAGLAGHAGNQSLQLKLGVDHRGGGVTAETIARLIANDGAAGGLLPARRRPEN